MVNDPVKTSTHDDNASVEEVVIRALQEYQTAIDAGHRLDRAELLARYPEVNEELASCLEGMELLQGGASDFGGREPGTSDRSPVTLGDFRIVREIGRGGMGIVYEAEQLSLRRNVALKVLPFAALLDDRQITRFENEARAAATVHHTNIVPIHFVGSDRHVHFYAMQLIDGPSLAEVIAELRDESRRSPEIDAAESVSRDAPAERADSETAPVAALSTQRSTNPKRFFRRAAEIGIQIADALQHAHQHGVIHRDVKPANILIDRNGKPWITDFGLARIATDPSLTTSGDLLGTLRYMSPEQASGSVGVDHRSDIYSLGITLYELASGQRAFPTTDRQRLLDQIATEEPKPPRQIDPNIPRDLETIILKCIAKDPSARYASAEELAGDLQRFTDLRPIVARRQSRLSKTIHWARRNRTVTAVSTAALLMLLTLAIGGPVTALHQRQLALEVTRERNQARENLHLACTAIDDVVSPAYWDIAYSPKVGEMRESLLLRSIQFYENLEHRAPNDLRVRHGHAKALLQLAHLNFSKGTGVGPLALRAADIYEELVAAAPLNPQYRRGLASAQSWIGDAYWIDSQWTLAESYWRNAVREMERILATSGDKTEESGRQLLGNYQKLAMAMWQIGRLREAASQFQAVFDGSTGIRHRDFPVRQRWLELFGRWNFANLLIDMGRYDEAAQQLEIVTSLATRALADSPTSLIGWYSLEVEVTKGRLSIISGHYDEAVERLNDTLHRFNDTSARDIPEFVWYDRFLGQLHHLRGEALTALNKLSDAEEAYRKSQEHWLSDRHATARGRIGLALWRLGELSYVQDRVAEGDQQFAEVLVEFEAEASRLPEEPSANKRLIIFLSTCPAEELQDPERALQLAEKYYGDSDGPVLRYLAIARRRNGQFDTAGDALNRCIEVRGGADAIDWLLFTQIALAADDGDAARRAFQRAREAINNNQPIYFGELGVVGFQRLRAETTALMEQ